MCTIKANQMMYGSWNMESKKWNFLSFWTIFFPFIPLQPKKSKFCKNEKITGDKIILHMCNINDNHYDVWFLRYEAWQTKFFVILDHFLPFYPSNNLENQNFGKLKKTPSDIIISHKCTKNLDHMLHCSLDMACNRFNYFSFWAIFALLPL